MKHLGTVFFCFKNETFGDGLFCFKNETKKDRPQMFPKCFPNVSLDTNSSCIFIEICVTINAIYIEIER